MAWSEEQIKLMEKRAADGLPAVCLEPDCRRRLEVRVHKHMEGEALIVICNGCGQQANFERQ